MNETNGRIEFRTVEVLRDDIPFMVLVNSAEYLCRHPEVEYKKQRQYRQFLDGKWTEWRPLDGQA